MDRRPEIPRPPSLFVGGAKSSAMRIPMDRRPEIPRPPNRSVDVLGDRTVRLNVYLAGFYISPSLL